MEKRWNNVDYCHDILKLCLQSTDYELKASIEHKFKQCVLFVYSGEETASHTGPCLINLLNLVNVQ